MSLPSNEIKLIVTFVQAILYGFYIATLMYCLRWLLYNDRGWELRKKINRTLVTITVLIFLFATTSLATALWRTIAAITNGDEVTAKRLDIVNGAMENATIVVVDAVLIYRCWAVYGKSWLIASPIIVLWLADIIFALLFVSEHQGWVPKLWIGFYTCNIAINIYATTAIILRVVSNTRGSKRTSGRLYKTCRILAESGVLYTAASILNLITGFLGANPKYNLLSFIADIVNFMMAGIAFHLVVIRVRQESANGAGDDEYVDSLSMANVEGQLSTLKFHVPNATDQTESSDLTDVERGISTRVKLDEIK